MFSDSQRPPIFGGFETTSRERTRTELFCSVNNWGWENRQENTFSIKDFNDSSSRPQPNTTHASCQYWDHCCKHRCFPLSTFEGNGGRISLFSVWRCPNRCRHGNLPI